MSETATERKNRLWREQELALDAALLDWIRTPDAAASQRLMQAAREYLGIKD